MKLERELYHRSAVRVAPFAGAWIEILNFCKYSEKTSSLPSRERGLKYQFFYLSCKIYLSLPSRERGLKFEYREHVAGVGCSSLPSRERGLKSVSTVAFSFSRLSLPSRERGLKSYALSDRYLTYAVAPFAGAWIEIGVPVARFPCFYVAPFAGAWIEICPIEAAFYFSVSLPSRERGLKLCRRVKKVHSYPVAPFMGAWIEICGVCS